VIAACDSEGMTTTSIEQLEKQIEQLVRDHIVGCRQRAAAAVERGFSSAAPRATRTRAPATRASSGRRRPSAEIAGLGERLYQAVCANPGATMMVLAAHVGVAARELNRPAQLLKRAGRVRSVGQRQGTRYFPMAAKTAS